MARPSAPSYSKDRRDFVAGARAAALWVRNPVSEAGAKQAFRMVYALLGPDLHRSVERMRRDPETARLLRDKPDLGMVLADMRALGRMPEGSVGRLYHQAMDRDDVFPGYVLGGLAYKDGHFDRLVDWDEDAKFLISRIGNTHDLMHVLAGYRTDFPGEALNIPFTLTSAGLPGVPTMGWAAAWGLASALILNPPIPAATWVELCVESARRGAVMAKQRSVWTIYFEELLHLPVGEARARLGIPPHRRQRFVDDEGFVRSRDWMRGRLAQSFASGFGQIDEAVRFSQRLRPLVENGVPIREVMSAKRETVLRAVELLEAGSSVDEARKVFC